MPAAPPSMTATATATAVPYRLMCALHPPSVHRRPPRVSDRPRRSRPLSIQRTHEGPSRVEQRPLPFLPVVTRGGRTFVCLVHEQRHRDRGTAEGVPPTAGEDDDPAVARTRPRGSGRRRVRLPRTEWSGEDDDDPLPARSGRARGRPLSRARAARHRASCPTVMRRVGAIVETPALYPTMTVARTCTSRAIDRIGRAHSTRAELVALAERLDDKVSTYSLGMRQRLGIAQALLGNPDILILDEPANGLDPAGIREIRQLVRHLAPSAGSRSSCRATCCPRSSRRATASRSSTAAARLRARRPRRRRARLGPWPRSSLLVGLCPHPRSGRGQPCRRPGSRWSPRGVVVALSGVPHARRRRALRSCSPTRGLVRHGAAARRGHARGAVPSR